MKRPAMANKYLNLNAISVIKKACLCRLLNPLVMTYW